MLKSFLDYYDILFKARHREKDIGNIQNVNLNLQTWSAEDQSPGKTCPIQNITAGCEIKEGPGCRIQLPGATQWQGGSVLPRRGLLLRLHVSRSVRKDSIRIQIHQIHQIS